ncbi:MAG: mechanosensitive ion channel [Clostridia bacterium]|nr:mechanosensitive ion channel [Clostridia bacterium]
MNWQEFFQRAANALVSWATNVGIKLLIALAVMAVAFRIINLIGRRIEKSAEKHRADKTIMRTAAYIFRVAMKLAVAVCLVSYVGIDTGGFAALIASLGVCVGLAVNGALSNLAGGVLIILTRPFRIDDMIEAQGYSGIVEDIHITHTVLRTLDNKTVYIPNGPLSSGTVVNCSRKDIRRVDEVFHISHDADYRKAKEILTEIVEAHPLALKEPAPFVRLGEPAGMRLSITVRVWVRTEDYWTVKADLPEAVKERFDAAGIAVPFEQMDVHIRND